MFERRIALANKFLDEVGLIYIWSKIVGIFATKDDVNIRIQQGLVDQPLICADHIRQRGRKILQIPLQNQSNLKTDKAGKYESIGLQLRGVQKGKKDLIFHLQKMNALVHHKAYQVIADNDFHKILFFPPEGQIPGDDCLPGGIFRQFGGQVQNAGVEFPADDAAETAVLVGEVIIKGFPGNAQLVAQIRNADGRIGPLEEIFIQTLLNLLLAAVSGGGAGNLGMIH